MRHACKRLVSVLLSVVLLSGGIPTDVYAQVGQTADPGGGRETAYERGHSATPPDAELPDEDDAMVVIPDREEQPEKQPGGNEEQTDGENETFDDEAATPSDADQPSGAEDGAGLPGEQPDSEEEATLSNAIQATPANALQAGGRIASLSRTLLEDPFTNGDNWKVTGSAVSFSGGKAHIKGSGPNNRMGSIMKINADNFLIELELTLNAGNTNCNSKIGFKAAEGYDGERLQLRLNTVQSVAYLEKNGSSTPYASVSLKDENGNLVIPNEHTYKIAIQVEGDTITAYLDGKELLSATNSEIGAMGKGYFVIAGQYPSQDFSIDNLLITTDEAQQGQEYKITLKTATDGVEDPAGTVLGGTLTADKASGYAGDVVTLFPKVKHGYVFDGYASYKADGSSTDGLMPITNNKFELNEKFGDVTVVAHFKTRVPGKDELLYDDFGLALNSENQYSQIAFPQQAVIEEEALVLDAPSGKSNFILVDPTIFNGVKSGDGYRISMDLKKANSNSGTLQIEFRGNSQGIAERYALAINSQGAASFRRFHSGENKELKKCTFLLTKDVSHVEIEVNGNQVAFLADGKELMNYEVTDGWSQMPAAAGLINMTAGAPIIFDNFLIEKIPQKYQIDVSVMYHGQADPDYRIGTASANLPAAAEGEEVILTASPKSGYRFVEYKIVEYPELSVVNGRFTMPQNTPSVLHVNAVFEDEVLREAQNFYIDSQAGNDAAVGTSPDTPWKTLSRLKQYGTFVRGDQILLKRGSVFNNEQLAFPGMGQENAPIRIDAYGEGDLPRLNGNGKVENVVSLKNQQYIEISNLEITNTAPEYNSTFELNKSNNRNKALRAINVSVKDFGTANGIHIRDCYIHDINGNIGAKWNGGIFFDVQAAVSDGELTGIPSKYDDVLIANCTFERVDRSGIKLVSSSWCNQWEKNSPGVPVNWYPSTNIVIRENYMEKIGGDGITVRDTDGALIEHNLVRDCRYQDTAYNVGIWPFEAANTVIQYNEAYDTHSTQDGQGLDCDHASSNSVMQYNYSHNNEGGFMLIMAGYPHTGATVRYNISQNDRDKAFEFAQGCPNGTMIYNNTIYSDTVIPKGIFYLSNTGAGLGVNKIFAYNNLFSYPQGQEVYGTSGDTQKLKDALQLYNNAYAGGMTAPAADQNALTVANAGLVNPGSAPETNLTRKPYTGSSGKLDGYQLKADSLLIDKGVTMNEAIVHFGGTQPFDGRKLSPRELYEIAKSGNSIDYVMGDHFPEISGVSYQQDFFGNNNAAGTKPDIGAMEYSVPAQPDVPNIPEQPEAPDQVIGTIISQLDELEGKTEEEQKELVKKVTEEVTAVEVADESSLGQETFDQIARLEEAILSVYGGQIEPAQIRTAQDLADLSPQVTGALLNASLDAPQKKISVHFTEGDIDAQKIPTSGISMDGAIKVDITLYKGETAVQPSVPLLFIMRIPDELKGRRLVAIHYHGTQKDVIQVTINPDDTMSFPAVSLSAFLIAEQTGEVSFEGQAGQSGQSSDSDGEEAIGGAWMKDGTGWWYRYARGLYPSSQWMLIDGSWYHFDERGYMQTGWILDKGSWYYLGKDGKMLENQWVLYKDQWYYLYAGSGAMAKNTITPDGFRVDSDGARVK